MFLSIPFIKGDNCDNEHTKGEKLRPCNHCDHPLAFVWGCQKFTPERGNRLPWHGSAINRISHISSIVNASAGICSYGGFWAACAARFQKGILPSSDSPALCLSAPGVPACAPRRLRCRLRFLSPAQGPGFVMAPSVPKPRGRTKFGEGNQPVCVRFISHIICIIKSGTRIWPLTFFFCRL